jgi:predicted Zn-dependent protease
MRKEVLYNAAIAVGIGLLIYKKSLTECPFTGKLQPTFIPISLEKFLGELAAKAYMAQHAGNILGSTTPEHVLVNAVARKITPYVPVVQDWNVSVVNTTQAEAFVTPNGRVFVTTGLLEKQECVDDLSFTLGHEFAHVFLRHRSNDLSTSVLLRGFGIGVQFYLIGRTLFPTTLPMELISSQHSSKAKETEANLCGSVFAMKAGYDLSSSSSAVAKFKAAKDLMMAILEQEVIYDEERIALPTYQPLVYLSQGPSLEEMAEKRDSLEDTDKLFATYRAKLELDRQKLSKVNQP